MKNKILRTIREHDLVREGMHVVVGLSGGPDSMCMFDVLCRIAAREFELTGWVGGPTRASQDKRGPAAQDERKTASQDKRGPAAQETGGVTRPAQTDVPALYLHPVHVNHRFRPGAAEEDQAFVEKFCRERGWPCKSFVIDCSALAAEEGLTSEEAGRKARYQSFRQVADEIVAGGVEREKVVIAVAQNANDQCETILFRLLRGTGVDGLSGIAYKRWDESGTAVVRPLLDAERAEIETYCVDRGLSPRVDHTNSEPVYMRNRIRLELTPFLKDGYNRNIVETVNRLGRLAAADREYIWSQAEEAYEKARRNGNFGMQRDGDRAASPSADCAADRFVDLDCGVLLDLHPAVRRRVYGRAFQAIGLTEDVTAAHLEGIDRILHSEKPSASWSLPGRFAAVRRYDCLRFKMCAPGDIGSRLGDDVSRRESGRPDGAVSQEDDKESSLSIGDAAVFDLDALEAVYGEDAPGRIILRSRMWGDYIQIRTGGALHRKKLQDMLVDLKVPKEDRDQLKLAAIGSEILWILPGTDESGRPDAADGKLGEKGRFSAAYRAGGNSSGRRIALTYSGKLSVRIL